MSKNAGSDLAFDSLGSLVAKRASQVGGLQMIKFFMFGTLIVCSYLGSQTLLAAPDDLSLVAGKGLLAARASQTAFEQAVRYQTLNEDQTPDEQCAGLLLVGGYLLSARHCIEPQLANVKLEWVAVKRVDFMKKIRESQPGLTPKEISIQIFDHKNRPHIFKTQIAAIGAGNTSVDIHGVVINRFYTNALGALAVPPASLDVGTQGDWVLLKLESSWSEPLAPIVVSKKDYHQGGFELLAIGAPGAVESRPEVSGEDLYVCPGQSKSSVDGVTEVLTNFSRQTPGFLNIERQIYSKTGFMTNPFIPGYSGGPIVDSMGNDIGLVSFYIDADSLRAYEPLSEILGQLQSDHVLDPSIPDLSSAFIK
jgi:hypothetical protein